MDDAAAFNTFLGISSGSGTKGKHKAKLWYLLVGFIADLHHVQTAYNAIRMKYSYPAFFMAVRGFNTQKLWCTE
jgi:hypothetical protein